MTSLALQSKKPHSNQNSSILQATGSAGKDMVQIELCVTKENKLLIIPEHQWSKYFLLCFHILYFTLKNEGSIAFVVPIKSVMTTKRRQ